MAANNRGGRRNQYVAKGTDNFIQMFKNEIAAELGVANYDQIDKGALPSRVHGMIGGSMTKRLVEMGQKYLAGLDPAVSELNPSQFVQHMQQDLVQGSGLAYANATTVPTPEQTSPVIPLAASIANTQAPNTLQ